MKKAIGLLALPLLYACGGGKNSDSAETAAVTISYQIDTVQVEAGDEFIYLNWNLTSSGESIDGKYLYNFNRDATTLELINLEELKLEKIIPYQKEGPDGIGYGMITKVYPLANGNFILSDNYQVSKVDRSGRLIESFTYSKQEFEGGKLPADKRIQLNETLSKEETTLVALYGGQEIFEPAEGLAIFELGKKSVRYAALDVFKDLEKYQSTYFYEGKFPIGMVMAETHLWLAGDTLYYSNSAENKLYFYNLQTDSLTSRSYASTYTSPIAKRNYPSRTESEEEFKQINQEKQKEVNYGKLFFDAKNKVYWRFSKEMDQMKGDTVLFKTVLTAFDPEYNQLQEELLPSNFVLPYKYFARDGMIYTFLNSNDELAFVRIKPTISYE